jgi:hypothetical protein
MLKALAIAAKAAGVALGGLALAGTAIGFKKLIGLLHSAVVWFNALRWAAVLAYAKIFLIVGLIALLVLGIQDLYVWLKGGDSVFGRAFGKPPKMIKDLVKAFGVLWRAGKRAFSAIWQAIKDGYREIRPDLLELKKAFVELWEEIKPHVKTFVGLMIRAQIEMLKLGARILPYVVRAIVWGIKNIGIPLIRHTINTIKMLIRVFVFLGQIIQSVFGGVKKVWDATFGHIVKAISWLLRKVGVVRDKLSELGIVSGRTAQTGIAAGIAKSGGVTSDIRVGAMNINVTGSADMNAPGMRDMMREGVKLGLNDLVKTSYRNYREQPG